jgi:hypothetical protein
MKPAFLVVILLSCGLPLAAAPCVAGDKVPLPQPRVQWTVLVFANGDDGDLEEPSVADFREMARVPNNANVNVVMQLDRAGGSGNPLWGGTARFYIRHQKEPRCKDAITYTRTSANMAAEETLYEFVQWGMANFPAKHYALILSCHGSGYRAIPSEDLPGDSQPKRNLPAFKASSPDDGEALYNAELVRAARRALDEVSKDAKFGVLGFDSCLMGMVETAYAVAPVAKYMVASEEMVSARGFEYEDLLRRLTASPNSTEEQVAAMMVASYAQSYGKNGYATLSALDLASIGVIADDLSTLSKLLRADIKKVAPAVSAARKQCERYALEEPLPFYHVDVRRFSDVLSNDNTLSPTVRAAAKKVADAVKAATGSRVYAGTPRQGRYGSHGLAIYFPASKAEFLQDPFNDGSYLKPPPPARKDDPDAIRFVLDHKWADFLAAYFDQVPK